MRILILIFWFLLFSKSLFFWLWLWQLKEYHLGRFRAHFETNSLKKIMAGFWRLKFPLWTKKTFILLISGLVLTIAFLWLFSSFSSGRFYLSLVLSLILSPIIFSLLILVFQIPTEIFKKTILRKAKLKREQFENLLVIALSGSYGKTATKEFLAEILSRKFKVLKTEKHLNAEIGIARTILNKLTDEYEIFVIEVGAYQKGKIKEVCQMIKPKIGVLTGINEQHMSTFGSLEKIIEAKYELIESLPDDGLAVFNGNNFYCRQLYEKTNKEKKIIFSDNNPFGEVLKKLLPWDRENFLMAAAAAESLGMKEEEIIKAASRIQSQIKISQGINGADIILSTYSANPKSVLSHLGYLEKWPGKKVLIMPCLIELGKSSKTVHQRIGEKIGGICHLAIITTRDRLKELKKGALQAGMPLENIIFCHNAKKIFEKIKKNIGQGDVILLESRLPNDLIKLLINQYDKGN